MIQYNKPNIFFDHYTLDNISEVLKSGWVSIGKNVKKAEDYFCERFGVKYAIACNNATQGLTIALKSSGWRDKRIAVPSFTWPSTVYAIESNVGNEAVFCDINKETFNIDLSTIPEDSYDAVVGVDIFGNECNVKTNKPLIYDAAHGFALKNLGKRGLAEVVSFSFTKIVTAMEGGMILTNDDLIAENAYELRRLSSRMTEINSIILMDSIKYYEENQIKKIEKIDIYKKNIDIEYVNQKIESNSNYSVFSIIIKETAIRNSIIKALEKEEIEYKVYYQPLVEGFSNTDWVFSHILCLPVYPSMKNEDVLKVCEVVNKASKHIHVGHDYLRNSKYLDKYIRNKS